MTELAELELWIREHLREENVDGEFTDGYIHGLYAVLKQIKRIKNDRTSDAERAANVASITTAQERMHNI